MITKDDINDFVEQTKSSVQEEIKRRKDPFDALNDHNKWVEEEARMQLEAEINKIFNDDIIYFDNEPFFRESDLVKSEENKDNCAKIEELDSKKGWKKWIKDEKSAVNHPEHYQNESGLETIDEMILLFGLEETMIFCKLNAWKYRARATKKGSEKEDLEKANWYILKYEELKNRSEEHDCYHNS